MKSERLKKLEAELRDLEQWLKLGLVPKKDISKHEAEIENISNKIAEEKDRLLFLKENDADEYVAPKRTPGRGNYQTEVPTVPDIDFGGGSGVTEGFETNDDNDSNTTEGDDSDKDDEDESEDVETEEEAESFFSERRRWRGEGIIDPEVDDW